ncbi:MAG: hypothetical protein D6793_03115, partial [Thermoflexia bacterium]
GWSIPLQPSEGPFQSLIHPLTPSSQEGLDKHQSLDCYPAQGTLQFLPQGGQNDKFTGPLALLFTSHKL